MGLVLMSERELNRIEVSSQVLESRLSVAAAAAVLVLSSRQVLRLLATFRDVGAAAIGHKAGSRRSNNRIRSRAQITSTPPSICADGSPDRSSSLRGRTSSPPWSVPISTSAKLFPPIIATLASVSYDLGLTAVSFDNTRDNICLRL